MAMSICIPVFRNVDWILDAFCNTVLSRTQFRVLHMVNDTAINFHWFFTVRYWSLTEFLTKGYTIEKTAFGS